MANQPNTTLKTIIDGERDGFMAVLSVPSINFEREAKFAMQILEANDFIKTTALNNQASLRNAITNVAAIGISLNPASKLAYLVPRKKAVCLDISYMGLMHIAQDSGAILWGQCMIVRKNDEFYRNGIDQQPTHKFKEFGTPEERGEIDGVYVTVKTREGDYLTHSMPIDAVYKIRDRSDAYKAWKADNTKQCPWISDPEEMIKKTCIKQAAKLWPIRSDRFDNAVEYLNSNGEGLDFTSKQEIELTPEQQAIYDKLKDAALDGIKALEAKVGELNASLPKGKERKDFSIVWTKHGEALKDGAKLAEDKVIKQ